MVHRARDSRSKVGVGVGVETKVEVQLLVEIEPNQFVLRVYDAKGHKDNYIASAIIRTYGDRGFMSSIIGRDFYMAALQHIHEIYDKCKVNTLEGYMTDVHARLLRLASSKYPGFEFSIPQRGLCAGRMMPWVVLRRL